MDSLNINKALFICPATDMTVEWCESENVSTSRWIRPEDWTVPAILLNPFLESYESDVNFCSNARLTIA